MRARRLRDYVNNRRLADELSLAEVVTVPTAVAVFHQFIDDGTPPREWAERLYNIRRWTPMPSGGHFPAAEVPGLLSRDIAALSTTSQSASSYANGRMNMRPSNTRSSACAADVEASCGGSLRARSPDLRACADER